LVIVLISIELINNSLNTYIKEEVLEEAIKQAKAEQLVNEDLITKAEAKLKRQVEERALLDKLNKTLTTSALHSSDPSNDMVGVIRSLEEVLEETSRYDTFSISVTSIANIGAKPNS
jgi:hypothetical protein